MIIHTKIQKWGNSLALRLGGAIREIPRLKEGTEVDIKIFSDGFTVTKAKKTRIFPYKETELLKNLSPETAHADLIATPLPKEFEQS